jgi:hypothetical protein
MHYASTNAPGPLVGPAVGDSSYVYGWHTLSSEKSVWRETVHVTIMNGQDQVLDVQ